MNTRKRKERDASSQNEAAAGDAGAASRGMCALWSTRVLDCCPKLGAVVVDIIVRDYLWIRPTVPLADVMRHNWIFEPTPTWTDRAPYWLTRIRHVSFPTLTSKSVPFLVAAIVDLDLSQPDRHHLLVLGYQPKHMTASADDAFALTGRHPYRIVTEEEETKDTASKKPGTVTIPLLLYRIPLYGWNTELCSHHWCASTHKFNDHRMVPLTQLPMVGAPSEQQPVESSTMEMTWSSAHAAAIPSAQVPSAPTTAASSSGAIIPLSPGSTSCSPMGGAAAASEEAMESGGTRRDDDDHEFVLSRPQQAAYDAVTESISPLVDQPIKLWLSGGPASGKSVVLSRIKQRLVERYGSAAILDLNSSDLTDQFGLHTHLFLVPDIRVVILRLEPRDVSESARHPSPRLWQTRALDELMNNEPAFWRLLKAEPGSLWRVPIRYHASRQPVLLLHSHLHVIVTWCDRSASFPKWLTSEPYFAHVRRIGLRISDYDTTYAPEEQEVIAIPQNSQADDVAETTTV